MGFFVRMVGGRILTLQGRRRVVAVHIECWLWPTLLIGPSPLAKEAGDMIFEFCPFVSFMQSVALLDAGREWARTTHGDICGLAMVVVQAPPSAGLSQTPAYQGIIGDDSFECCSECQNDA